MKISKKFLFPFLCFLSLVVGCDKFSNKNPIENVKEATDDKDLQNKVFRSDCSVEVVGAIASFFATSGKASLKSSLEKYQFIGANVTHTTSFYESSNCEGSEVLTYEELGSIDIHKNQRGDDQSKFIDINYDKLTLVVENEQGLEAASSLKLCGRSTWSKGKVYDVTSKSDNLNCYGKKLPVKEFNVYLLDGKNLYFGKSDVKSKNRPTYADMSKAFSVK